MDSGGPSAMTLPAAMTTTQSLMSRTTSMSCSTNTTVMPSSRRSLTCPSRLWVSAGVTPAVGPPPAAAGRVGPDAPRRHARLGEVLGVPEQALGQRRVHPGHGLVQHDDLRVAH